MKNKKIKIGISGRFGFDKEMANGQTIKTKIITEKLVDAYGPSQVLTADTYGAFYKTPLFLKDLFHFAKNCDNVIIFPAHKGVRIFAPFLSGLKNFFNFKVHYIVIGGWLPDLIKNNIFLQSSLKKFDCIYVETCSMQAKMSALGFQNIVYMPNFKDIHICEKAENNVTEDLPLKLVIFSRLNEKKGVTDAVDTVNEINNTYGKTIFTLDLYGQIADDYREKLNNMIQASEHIKYKGIIDASESSKILQPYFALLFPTKYYTEGIPGTVIDAYAAGLPVIASAWENAGDIIRDGVTGRIYSFEDNDALKQILLNMYHNPATYIRMRNRCGEEAREYTSAKIMPVLLENLK